MQRIFLILLISSFTQAQESSEEIFSFDDDLIAAAEAAEAAKSSQQNPAVLKVPYQKALSTEPQHTIIMTEGLNPCIALLLKGTNEEGKTIVCLTHLNAPVSQNNVMQSQDAHISQISDFYDNCHTQLLRKGLQADTLQVMYHAAEKAEDSTYSTASPQQQNDINFRKLLKRKVENGDISDFKAVYFNTPQFNPRTLKYDIPAEKYQITKDDKPEEILLQGEF